MYSDRRVLVAGGTGMIGSHIVEELLARGAKVRVVHHLRDNPHGDDVEVVEGDLRNADDCARAVDGMEAVFNATGIGGGSGKVSVAPIQMFVDPLVINAQLIEAARLAGVGRFLLLSNSSVYATASEPLPESDAWGETTRGIPENETGTVKRTSEVQCGLYQRFCDMETAIVRGGNGYGPRDYFDLENSHVLPALIRKAVERQDPYVIWGSGAPLRDFTHARDIARGALHVLEHHAVADPVNIATGVATSINEVAELILELAGHTGAEVQRTEKAPPVSPAKLLDVTKMRELGFAPQIDLREGLRETIDWYARTSATPA